MTTYGDDWWGRILTGIGAPVTPANIAVLKAWNQAEGGNAAHANNPFNTTWNGGGAVANYATMDEGVNATIATLKQPNGTAYGYSSIVKALRASSPLPALAAIVNSRWAEGHYNAKQSKGGGYNLTTSSIYGAWKRATANNNAASVPGAQLPPAGTVWIDTQADAVLDSTGKITAPISLWQKEHKGTAKEVNKPGAVAAYSKALQATGADPGRVTPLAFPLPNPVDTLAGNGNSMLTVDPIGGTSVFGSFNDLAGWIGGNMNRIGLAALAVLVIILAIVYANKGTITSIAGTAAKVI